MHFPGAHIDSHFPSVHEHGQLQISAPVAQEQVEIEEMK
jgi:hypothetical protein